MRRLPKQTGARVRAKHRRPKGQEATETQPGCVTFLTLAKILPAFPEFGEISPTLIVADVAAFTPEDFLYPRRGASEACFRTGRQLPSADEPGESRQRHGQSGTLTRCGLFACPSAICLATTNAPRALSCAVPACSPG